MKLKPIAVDPQRHQPELIEEPFELRVVASDPPNLALADRCVDAGAVRRAHHAGDDRQILGVSNNTLALLGGQAVSPRRPLAAHSSCELLFFALYLRDGRCRYVTGKLHDFVVSPSDTMTATAGFVACTINTYGA